jgi:hypothetical protein
VLPQVAYGPEGRAPWLCRKNRVGVDVPCCHK